MIGRRLAIILPAFLAAGACMVGPAYRRPAAPVPQGYKEMPAEGAAAGLTWKAAQPGDMARRTPWWEAFGDPGLNALVERVDISNQTIALAEAQYRAARAAVAGVRSSLFPSVGVGASATRSSGVSTASPGPGQAAPAFTGYEVAVDLGWEIDLFGRVRRSVQAGVASALASAADLESVRLTVQAEAAADYFLLRGVDAEIELLKRTVEGYRTQYELTQNRFRQGVASGIDVAQAKTQMASIEAEAADLRITRAQLEHALAVLAGSAPQEFALAAAPAAVAPPAVPVGLPSELLERRPDIAAAERRVAAANARIGVAVAGFFPTLSLSGLGGYQGSPLSSLFSLPARVWSLGASLAETVFNGGQRRSTYLQARAAYDGTVAEYRQTVLTALEQVEDNLAALRLLAEEARYQTEAVSEAERTLKLANNRYINGVTSYLEVVTAQNTALANELQAVGLLTRQLTASVNLIKALGGGWRVSDLSAPASPKPPAAPDTKRKSPSA
ncbi:MAG TPA: efflux transporter outer membrane subunit [Terriglobales bacterium]|nr:efflux transporter outer membrane subunit [Terriglobales bacterium]